MRSRHEVPGDLAKGAARFAAWRGRRIRGKRIPEALWQVAVALAARYGISRVSQALRVGYYALQDRLEEQSPVSSDAEPVDQGAPPTSVVGVPSRLREGFVEMPQPGWPVVPSELVVEVEKHSGDRIRVRGPASHIGEVSMLVRTVWELR